MLSQVEESVKLRDSIRCALQSQGFVVTDGTLNLPADLDKDTVRLLHQQASEHAIVLARLALEGREERLLRWIAHGNQVDPRQIRPVLVEVKKPESEEGCLFRYLSLHWSVPVSTGYGRRLRFLVVDEYNGKVMGIIGLGDPVFSLHDRDGYIGWTFADRRERLRSVVDAFILGAIPPYSYLLCGKLVAMLATSDEVRQRFESKYQASVSLIRGRPGGTQVALLTTTSALGRSSMYNRITFDGTLLYHPAGHTRGYGEFHFANGLYSQMVQYVNSHDHPTAKKASWGKGFRNRREVVRKCLKLLGLPHQWDLHGVRREIYVVPLASNFREFLRGETGVLQNLSLPAADLVSWFEERWLLRRLERDVRYRSFDPECYRLWPNGSDRS